MPQSVSGESFFGRFSSSARSSLASKELKATIQLLDDSETIQCEFKKSDTGQVLLDYVCETLNVVEKDYFGLRYQDVNKYRYWLDTTKQITKQVRVSPNLVFRLRIRYYPADPTVIKEEVTRYQLFLQLRRDLLHGRLYCPQAEAANLGAYIIQSELGDYDPIEHKEGYVSEYKLFLKQTAKLEEKIAQVHRGLSGLTPAQAELEFLKRAALFDTYGFDPHTVKDAKQGSVYIGVTHRGILVYQANRKVHHIKWNDLDKVDYLGKEFRVYPKASYFNDDLCPPIDGIEKTQNGSPPTETAANNNNKDATSNGHDLNQSTISDQNNTTAANSGESPKGKRGAPQVLKYQCPSANFAKHLWRHTLSQQAFFTVNRATDFKPKFSKPRIPLLSRGSTFRYSGRVLHEIEEAETPNRDNANSFVRYHLEKQPGRDERQYPWLNKYSTMPRNFGSKNKNSESGLDSSLDSNLVSREAPNMTSSQSNDRVSHPVRPIAITTDSGKGSPTFDFSPSAENSRPASAIEREKVSPNESSILANSSGYRSDVHDWSAEAKPVANSTPKKTGAARNGTVYHAQQQQQALESGPCRRLLRSVLTALLFTFILVTIIVAIFEVKDRHFQQYVHAVPGAEHVRHQIYEPSRGFILEQYSRVTSGRH